MSRRLRLCTVLFSATLGVTGCTTHEARFESAVPPPPVDRLAQERTSSGAAAFLIDRFRSEINALPADALAPLTKSAALLFEVTGAPGMRRATRIFADQLLQARVPVENGNAFYSLVRPGKPSEETTVEAGDALIDAFLATGEEPYRAAVADASRAVISRPLGWTRLRTGFAVRTMSGARYYSVSQTASAAAFLFRAAEINADPEAQPAAVKAMRLVTASQVAAGRWYENFVGHRSPMTLASWASTLLAMGSTGPASDRNIENAGAPGLWTAAFSSGGTPLNTPLSDQRGLGLAIALRLFNHASGTQSYADLACRYVLDDRRPDGTVKAAAPHDAVVQAYYALAFAQRAQRLKQITD